MFKITFKNVGQGDSIIIAWETDKNPCYGVIDCNLKLDSNPVIDHLQALSVTELEFVILSHPHYDHYSGMESLFDYCLVKNIPIKKFYFTLTPKTLLKKLDTLLTDRENNAFYTLLVKINELLRKKVIISKDIIKSGMPIPVGAGYALDCLSPSNDEIERIFNSKDVTQLFEREADKANWVSTVFRLSSGNKKEQALLTSDALPYTLRRVLKELPTEFNTIAAQVPHHGSKYNFEPLFWQDLKRKNNCKAIFSVGKSRHKHPHKEVVTNIHNLKYKILATNLVNGLLSKSKSFPGLSVFPISLKLNKDIGQDIEILLN